MFEPRKAVVEEEQLQSPVGFEPTSSKSLALNPTESPTGQAAEVGWSEVQKAEGSGLRYWKSAGQ